MSNVYTVTHVEHGWDDHSDYHFIGSILQCFSCEESAKQFVEWYCEYCGTPKDVLVIHTNELHQCFVKESFE